ncbi:MAG: hypothetical protein V8K32_08755 [Candidatus Electrothrix gigas]
MNEKEGEILLPNTGLKLRQKRRDKGKRHNLDDNTDFSNRSNLKRRDSCVQNFSLRYFHIEKKLRSESLIITRIKPSVTFYGCALARQFESMNVLSMNSSDAIIKSRDKLFSLQLMLTKGINIPTTGFAKSPIDTGDLIEMVGGAPLIVKLLEGTQGRGVVLAETKKAAESVINAFKALQANLLVQEFIKEADEGC